MKKEYTSPQIKTVLMSSASILCQSNLNFGINYDGTIDKTSLAW